MSRIHPANATANSTTPTPVIISVVTSPHTRKVIPNASVTGHIPGSGSFSGGRTVHPRYDSGGTGFDVSVAMRFLHESFVQLRFRDNGFVAGLAIPAGKQPQNP